MSKTPGKSHIRGEIDANLRRVYEDALKQEVPDRFRQLLEQLRQKDAEKPGDGE